MTMTTNDYTHLPPSPTIDMAHSMVDDSSSSHYSTLFRQAISTLTACGGGSGGSSLADFDCFGLVNKCNSSSATRRNSIVSSLRMDITGVANKEALKIVSLMSQQLSASKAILQDVETLALFLERLLS